MKHILSLLSIPLALSLSSCEYVDFLSDCSRKNISTSDSTFIENINLKKIDTYLYEATFENYDLNEGEAMFDSITIPFGACTSVRNGNFIGRNLDWIYDESVSFVVHTPAKNGKHATLGIAGIIPYLNKFNTNYGTYDFNYKLIPFAMMDGINDAGVTANINVQPLGDRGLTTGTNPGKERMNTVLAVRYILDYAGSVDEAIQLLGEKDLHYTDIIGSPLEVHIMITDPHSTAIVEFVDNKMVVVRDSVIMTNYFVSQGITPHAQGVERAEVMRENYAMGSTKEGMQNLMKKVFYTKLYDLKTSPRWYSDMYDGSTADGRPDLTWDTDQKTVKKYYLLDVAKFKLRTRLSFNSYHTVHSSVYDNQNKTLDVTVQEENFSRHFEMK